MKLIKLNVRKNYLRERPQIKSTEICSSSPTTTMIGKITEQLREMSSKDRLKVPKRAATRLNQSRRVIKVLYRYCSLDKVEESKVYQFLGNLDVKVRLLRLKSISADSAELFCSEQNSAKPAEICGKSLAKVNELPREILQGSSHINSYCKCNSH